MSEDNNKQEENKKEKKKSKTKKININTQDLKETLINYIIPLVSLVLIALIGYFVLYPSYKEIPDLQAQVDQKSKLESNLEKKLSNLNRLVDFKSVVAENSDLVNRVLVSEPLVPGLLTQVDRIVRESGLEINRLNYGMSGQFDGSGGLEADYVTVNLGVRGSFGQLLTFFKNIENAARMINVDQLRYSSGDYLGAESLSSNLVLVSPFIYVESNAVTDDPINLDISDPKFTELISKIKTMKYYDPNFVDTSVPVEEAPVDEETTEGEAVAEVEETAETGESTEGVGTETATEETPVEDSTSIFPN